MTSLTIKYKCGYIHFNDNEIKYQTDKTAYSLIAKSERAAKTRITKHYNEVLRVTDITKKHNNKEE